MSAPDLAIFDLGGVVVEGFQTIGRIARKYHLDEEKLHRDYLASDGPLMEGTLSTKGWWLHVCDRFSLPESAREADPLYDEFDCHVDPLMVSLIREVRGTGVRVVCGSNTCDPHWRKMEKAGDLTHLFDACYLSQEMHIRKPDEEFFLTILQREHVSPSQSVFIDDTKENADAASSLGIDAIWYRSDAVWSKLDRVRVRFGLLK